MTLADILLLAVLVLISISGFIFIKKAFPQGKDVKIEVNGKLAYKLPLNNNAIIAVKGINGDTVVEIKNRKVRIKESPCPNKICVHTGWIDRGAVICLPNRVTVF
ncbi:MAG: NusG domain II-containing protein, partial [Nitrospirae bacterium]|nr:NusG domain II-containing protein [Nitrospirota bacterium]